MSSTSQFGQTPARFLSLAAAHVSVNRMATCLREILGRTARGRFSERAVRGELRLDGLYDIEPLRGGAHAFRVLIYEPRSDPQTSVLMTNLRDGWSSVCGLLAHCHLETQAQIICTPENTEYPKYALEVWRGGDSIRSLMLMKDSDQWQFYHSGAALPFETIERYDRRPKKARVDRRLIVAYLRDLGWDLGDDSFWEAAGDQLWFEEDIMKRPHRIAIK